MASFITGPKVPIEIVKTTLKPVVTRMKQLTAHFVNRPPQKAMRRRRRFLTSF
jgi:hypothetical protein